MYVIFSKYLFCLKYAKKDNNLKTCPICGENVYYIFAINYRKL